MVSKWQIWDGAEDRPVLAVRIRHDAAQVRYDVRVAPRVGPEEHSLVVVVIGVLYQVAGIRVKYFLIVISPTRGVTILVLNSDPEPNFQLFGDSGSWFESITKWNHNAHRVLLFPAWIRSQIFSFLAIRDPVKSGIVTPLVPTDCRCLVKYSDLCMRFRQKCVPGCPRWRASCGGPSQPRWAPPCRWSPTRPCRRSRRRQCPGAAWSPGECFTVPFWICRFAFRHFNLQISHLKPI